MEYILWSCNAKAIKKGVVNMGRTTKSRKAAIAWLCVLGLMVGCLSGSGTGLSKSKAADPEFTEYTFSDFGIEDRTVSGASPEFATGFTSWDKVAISGKVTMPGTNADDHYIRFGSWTGFEIRSAGNALILTGGGGGFGSTVANSDGNTNGWVYIPADGDVVDSQGKQRVVPIRITMEHVNRTNLKVCLTVDGKNSGWITFTNQSNGNFNILLYAAAGKTMGVASIEKEEPKPVEFTEYSFNDFGIKDQTVSNGNAIDKDTGLTSWDKVAISGKVTFPGIDADDHYIRFGSWGGLSIRASKTALILTTGSADFGSVVENSAKDGNGWLYVDTGEDITDKAIDLRVTFEHVNKTQLKMTATINGTHSGYITVAKQTNGNFNLLIYAGDGRSITIGSPEQPEKVYDEYTFADFGIKNQIAEAGMPVRNVKQPIQSWKDMAISGIVTFPASTESYLRFGTTTDGWEGFSLRWADGGDLALINEGFSKKTVANSDGNANGWVLISKTQLGYEDTIAGQFLQFRLTFEYTDNGENILATLTVTGKDSASATAWMKVQKPDTEYYGILAYGGGGNVNIASTGTTPVEPEKPDPISETPQKPISSYKEITFKDFLMQDRVVVGDGVQGQVESLNGRVFKGKVTFPQDGDGLLRIGGTKENEWFGIQVSATEDGLRLSEAANGRQVWDISKDKIGTDVKGRELELWLTFTQVDEHNVYVGVYVNGTFCGEKLFKNLQEPFGSKLLVYSSKAGIRIASVDTAWTRLIKSRVNFAYWGFTDNWKKELAVICK